MRNGNFLLYHITPTKQQQEYQKLLAFDERRLNFDSEILRSTLKNSIANVNEGYEDMETYIRVFSDAIFVLKKRT